MSRALRPLSQTSPSTRAFFTSRLATSRPTTLPSNFITSLRRYTPDMNQQRIFTREIFFKKSFIWSCIGTNSIVFLLWSTSSDRRDHAATKRTLFQNFMLSTRNVQNGRWWTILTSAFSHRDLGHFAVNMFTFHQIAQHFVYTFGLKALPHLAPLTLGSAIAGSVAFLQHDRAKPKGPYVERMGLGFSGAVSGVVTAAALLFPTRKMLLMGIIPMPLWVLGLGYIAYDTYSMDAVDSTVGHDAHIGGAVFGAAFYMVFLRRFGGLLGARRGF